MLDRKGNHGFYRGYVREVNGICHCLTAIGDFLRHAGCARAINVGYHYLRAACSEEARHACTYARGAASDERHPARKFRIA